MLLRLLLAAASASMVSAQTRPTVGPIYVDPHDEQFVLKQGTEVPLLLPEIISSKDLSQIRAVVATDVVVDDVIIIRKGEPVVLSVGGSGPKSLSRGAVMRIQFESVRSLSGLEVQIFRSIEEDAGPGCAMEGCVLVFLVPWVKGPHASIREGTLVGTFVNEDTKIPAVESRAADRALKIEREVKNSTGLAKIFFYGTRNSQESWHTLKVDSQKAAALGNKQWVCIGVPVGTRTIRVGKHEFTLDTVEGGSYYLELIDRESYVDLVETSGFKAQGQILHFVKYSVTKQFKTSCW